MVKAAQNRVFSCVASSATSGESIATHCIGTRNFLAMLKSVAANFELRCRKAFHLSANLWLTGHGLTLAMKMFSVYYPNHQFHPWTCGSQRCEDFFAKLRCFCRGKPNLTLLDMIDLSSRVQNLEELKSCGVNPDIQPPNWPQDIDVEFKEGMMMAEREVLKTLQLMGMLPALVKGNILKKDGDDIICLNTPSLGTFAVWESPEDYTLICPKHKDIKEHFRNKVTALSTDTNSLSDENISLQPMPKQLR